MNIYFAGSIRGGRVDAALYYEIIAYLSGWGTVLTEHVGDPALTEKGDDGPDDQSIYHRDMNWLNNSHTVIAEVTQPSLGVGYELGAAIALGKPVLALYRPSPGRCLSAMVSGCPDIRVTEYLSLDEAKQAICRFLTTMTPESDAHE
ncbi:MAG: nucleoside 2-deoxyribosyltransferase [Desulfobacterium sp.]|nr:nucleoside 2-deoxyribosyltransferase [Desulfobacterium sp.]MBU3946713.1 nucleoside 2-deoxyribosyltransferase [Pseudomonadota bacterium]MBU4037317.1 nucleoside 2-deoxyribosyltransferase [Pseudomonadota bacterium]